MKNFKKLFLVPVLALGTVTSCYGGNNDTKCPEEKKCETCPTPSESQGGTISKDGHSLTVEQSEIKVLVDEKYGSQKHIIAKVTPSSDTITYTSSDSSVATVSNKGVITGVTPNKECTITVKSSGNLLSAIKVKTYSVANYFACINTAIQGIVDRDVEELEFPSTNPVTGQNINAIWKTFSTVNYSLSGSFAFPRLKKIIVPEGYTTIEPYVFAGKAPLCESLYLPSTLSTCYSNSLFGLSNLKEIVLAEENNSFVVNTYEENGSKIIYYKSNKNVLKVFNHTEGLVCDPALGITKFEGYSIANTPSIKSIVFPEGVTTLSPYAVFYNKNLKSISLPSTITTISSNKVSFSIANENLETLTVEGNGFFSTNSSSRFSSINEEGNPMNAIAWIATDNQSATIVVATKGFDLTTKVRISSDSDTAVHINSMDNMVFLGKNLEGTYIIPDNIVYISDFSFSFNPKLKGIYIPKTVTSIPSNATSFITELNQIGPFFQGYPYNDGEFICIPAFKVNGGYGVTPFCYGAADDFVIYYQTRSDKKSFVEAFGSNSIVADGRLYTTKEVADSTLAEPVQEEEVEEEVEEEESQQG